MYLDCHDFRVLLQGNMWAQSWDSLTDILLPKRPDSAGKMHDIDDILKDRNISVLDIMKRYTENTFHERST